MSRDGSGGGGDIDRPCVCAFKPRRRPAGEGCRVQGGGTALGWEEKLGLLCFLNKARRQRRQYFIQFIRSVQHGLQHPVIASVELQRGEDKNCSYELH